MSGIDNFFKVVSDSKNETVISAYYAHTIEDWTYKYCFVTLSDRLRSGVIPFYYALNNYPHFDLDKLVGELQKMTQEKVAFELLRHEDYPDVILLKLLTDKEYPYEGLFTTYQFILTTMRLTSLEYIKNYQNIVKPTEPIDNLKDLIYIYLKKERRYGHSYNDFIIKKYLTEPKSFPDYLDEYLNNWKTYFTLLDQTSEMHSYIRQSTALVRAFDLVEERR